jgi:hypothetical protein
MLCKYVYNFFVFTNYYFLSTTSLRLFDTINLTRLPAGTFTFSPVLGLRASRALRSTILNMPTSDNLTSPPTDCYHNFLLLILSSPL